MNKLISAPAVPLVFLLVWLFAPGDPAHSAEPPMQAWRDPASGQVDLRENGQPVLRYNYQTIEPGERLQKISAANQIYARARSDYIHPLYGLEGEVLTKDWSVDHPHHRGIYWAWPEVDYGKERGDLHALQKVFARPTGRLKLTSGKTFAQVEGENLWRWEDKEPIVRELALIRAYPAIGQGRVVDLAFHFTALKDGVTLARRETDKYGGLNVRLEKSTYQVITTMTDPTNQVPRRCWSDLSGVFAQAKGSSGLAVFPCPQNPDYPGDWIQYPELAWVQPTFPAAKTRFALSQAKPLVLRYRLWIHAGRPGAATLARQWAEYQAAFPALPRFELVEKK